MKNHSSLQRGSALIVVLFMIVVMTLLLVGYVLSMQTERMAAAAMAGNERAKIIAQDAVEHATALLDNNIPQPVPLGTNPAPENWIISPGLLTKFYGADTTTVGTYIPLSTDALDSTGTNVAIPTKDYANLNASQLSPTGGTTIYPIIPTGEPVPMSWVYLLQDPTSAPSATNPVIGRYAFWMDDENAKININTAYGKPSTLLNTIPGNAYTYMVRSNPLDQSVDNGNTYGGTDPFMADVGFNSLVGSNYTYNDTSGIPHTFYNYPAPGDAADPASSTNSTAVGNTTPTAPAAPTPATGLLRYYPLWHPSAINIDILPTSLSNPASIGSKDLTGSLDRNSLADWVFNKQYVNANTFTQNWRLLQNPAQIQQFITTASPGPANFYQANEFNLTAYNRAPEFNAFGKPRLLLEDRIGTMQANPTSSPTDTASSRLSGTELAFYQTPDLDPLGPMYFHGLEQTGVYTGSGDYYDDLAAVQMVGDYLSTLLNYTNWPGMPTKSFVNKWTPASSIDPSVGYREADQVAWNIVAMGNYAPNVEVQYGNTADWPDDQFESFYRTSGIAAPDSAANLSPYRSLVSSQIYPGASQYDPNLCLRVGKLSGKAIMPYGPKPHLNEVGLVITPYPVDPVNQPGVFYLKMSMELDLYVPKRGPPGTFWAHNNSINFELTHFFYTAKGTSGTGTAVNFSQGATGGYYNGSADKTYGDGGTSDGYPGWGGVNSQHSGGTTIYPWTSCLAGGYYEPSLAPIPPATAAPALPTTYLAVNTYPTLATAIPNNVPTGAIWLYPGATMMLDIPGQAVPTATVHSSDPAGPPQTFKGTVTIAAKARVFLYGATNNQVWEIVPVWDNVDTNNGSNGGSGGNVCPALAPPLGQQDSIAWNFTIDLSSVPSTGGVSFTRSLEIADPRLGGNTYDSNGNVLWQPDPNTSNTSYTASASWFGGETPVASTAGFDPDSDAYYDFQGGGLKGGFYPNSPRPSVGFLSCVPTGMQRGIVNSSLTFGPTGSTQNPSGQLPDWLLLDLLAPSFMDTTQPSFAPYSYRHSTMGKININANLFPAFTGSSGTVQRNLPLEALFKNMVPDAALPGLVGNIMNHTLSAAAGYSPHDYGAQGQYDYIGELCEIAGVADGSNTPTPPSGSTGKWEKEALIRNLANLLTTQSNTYHVWGAAQAIQLVKGAGNSNYATYQTGDTVTVLGEKRFESVIERSVWPGVDGIPGNGHVNAGGAYDQTATSPNAPVPVPFPWAAVALSGSAATTAVLPGSTAAWAQFDGPDNPNTPRTTYTTTYPGYSSPVGYAPFPGWYVTPTYNNTGGAQYMINANNPARANMTYKPIMFRYITE